MRRLFLAAAVCCLTSAHAKNESRPRAETPPVRLTTCQERVARFLGESGAMGPWSQLVSKDPSIERWISPTSSFGRWAYLELKRDGAPTLVAQQSQYSLKSLDFNQGCSGEPTETTAKPSTDAKDDRYLKNLLSTDQDLLVVVWSPEMAYTAPGLQELEKLRKSSSTKIRYFLEESAPIAQAKALLKAENLPVEYAERLRSFDLRMRFARTHMPAVFHVKNGRLDEKPWRGFRRAEEYASLMSEGARQ